LINNGGVVMKGLLKRLRERAKKDSITTREDNDIQGLQSADVMVLFSMQWYERDQMKFAQEVRFMNVHYHQMEMSYLNDGRLCWIGFTDIRYENKETMIVYPYSYPMEPPMLILDLSDQYAHLMSAEGSYQFLEHNPDYNWIPSLTASHFLASAISFLNEGISVNRQACAIPNIHPERTHSNTDERNGPMNEYGEVQ